MNPITIQVQIVAPELSHALLALAGATSVGQGVAGVAISATQIPTTAPAPALVPAAAVPVVAQAAPMQTPAQAPIAASAPAVPVAPVTPQAIAADVPVVAAVPATTTRTYKFEDIQLAATTLCDAGKREEVWALLAKFNISALSVLPPEQYGAFATELRGMGAKI